jgi:hypothetical protein
MTFKRRPLTFQIIVTAIFLLSSLCPAHTAQSPLGEYEIKAAFIYQFTKFMEWPHTAEPTEGPFTICVLGEKSFDGIIHQLDSETVKDRKVEVRTSSDIIETNLNGCAILYIGKSEKPRISKILDQVQNTSVLTVSDMQGFLEKGGIVNFFNEGNKIRFGINQKQAEKSGIKISSKLLNVASQVIS